MTGFGAAEGAVSGRRIRVELRTVNHRHHHASVRLPPDLAGLEGELREALKRQIERGHVTAVVTWGEQEGAPVSRIDWGSAAAAVASLRELQVRFGLAGEVTVEQVARFPEVIGSGREAVMAEWESLEPVVDAAMGQCLTSRAREGAILAREIGGRLDAIGALAGTVAERAPARLQREMARLRSNLAALLDGAQVNDERVAQEVAVMADRVDITEELVRLGAHLDAARALLAGGRSPGRQLGFLAQEIGREVNTIGSKANDAAIAHDVVQMKGELEKVREQLENLE
ncbi:MAG TPA: YicC family protein [Gemmatimonadales bacterium]|nr:YicC family protein [Gemmatimonadales bacterium]